MGRESHRCGASRLHNLGFLLVAVSQMQTLATGEATLGNASCLPGTLLPGHSLTEPRGSGVSMTGDSNQHPALTVALGDP